MHMFLGNRLLLDISLVLFAYSQLRFHGTNLLDSARLRKMCIGTVRRAVQGANTAVNLALWPHLNLPEHPWRRLRSFQLRLLVGGLDYYRWMRCVARARNRSSPLGMDSSQKWNMECRTSDLLRTRLNGSPYLYYSTTPPHQPPFRLRVMKPRTQTPHRRGEYLPRQPGELNSAIYICWCDECSNSGVCVVKPGGDAISGRYFYSEYELRQHLANGRAIDRGRIDASPEPYSLPTMSLFTQSEAALPETVFDPPNVVSPSVSYPLPQFSQGD
ncbi:uncharacterized protein C8R40DRAFT_124317 [Lentinula edodes]|uniref:uncharacterized protein n=1 Tax=Lentinula edodes TaxID=5353 RepID=UPI001E8EBEC4|nr:uncharacterized protein C8R40DRAFT_124317 [Lentinula edodes]KAH7876264.1 hypothetical protein C8R40DRAFT_124317 [Lentinula edodes]